MFSALKNIHMWVMGRRVELLLCNRYQYSHTTLESFFWILVHGKEMRLPMRLYTLPKLSTLSHSWQSYSQGLKCRNNLIVLCWMNGHEDVMHTTIHPQAHPHAEYHSPQKREDPVLSHNMDESRGYCNKWNKPDIERKILHSLTYMWNPKLKCQKSNERRWRMQ